MNPNKALTRLALTRMGKDKSTLALPVGSKGSTSSDNQNNKRSREDLDRTDDEVESFDQLLVRIRQMIEDGNAKIERKIESSNEALVTEISTLRDEVNQLKIDYARDFNELSESHAKTADEVRRNKDAAGKLLKSNDLILSGVPYCPTEKTEDILQKVAVALGYGDSDVPPVFTKRLARVPIAAGATPPILFQFAFRASKDEFFQRYFSAKKLSLLHLGFDVDRRIYMNENLTEAARNIKGAALKLKRSGHLRNVFSKDGTIYVKPLEDVPAQPIFDLDQLAVFGPRK